MPNDEPMPRSFSETETVGPTSPADTDKIADLDAALGRMDGNRKLLRDMIGFFREDAPELLENIEAAIRSGDAPSAKRAAHSIKGLASNFEAESVGRQSQLIEQLAANGELDEIPSKMPALSAAIRTLQETLNEFESKLSLGNE